MKSDVFEFTVENDISGERIDVAISLVCAGLSRSAVQKHIAEEKVFVNEKLVTKNYKVCIGDKIKVEILKPAQISLEPQEIPLSIVYEDDDLLVVNKPRGMVVHPAAGNLDGTLVNALMFHCGDSLSKINGDTRPGIVHRIDKDTSGLLVVAKSDESHIHLAKQIKEHTFKREYKAIVHGNIRDDEGVIDVPIARSEKDRKKMGVTEKGRNAVTYFWVIERFGDFTYVKCSLKTGRTHQIRVHMAYRGNPIVGDLVYGPKNTPKLEGHCLHAERIGFTHPKTGKYLEFEAPLPEHFEKFLRKMRG
ncbi:MAG: RluA family pseudouridine synthase [Ruminococcaceae bacterium]|nr:RluA family pseudouridine synthase [Oscillospiraceae bacterium]